MSIYRATKGRSKGPKILLFITVLVVVALVGAVGYVRHTYYENLRPLNGSEKTKLVTVESGETAAEIAQTLEKESIIRKAWAFEWYVRNNSLRDKLQAGTYYLSPNQSIKEITDILTSGNVATELVTVLPGKRIDQLKQSLVNAGFNPDEVEAAFDPALYADHPALVDKPATASLEGYIYPETFQKTPTTKPQVVVEAALDQMHKFLTPEIRAGFVKQGLTVHQGVILASVVEKEVGVVADRPIVAQVFLKRLKIGMKLESDATTSYGAVLAGQEPTHDFDSLYNTYSHPGLMPGPISNVSESSLKAVAAPAGTDYLFFVAGNDCKTRFSYTIQEHESFIHEHGVGCR